MKAQQIFLSYNRSGQDSEAFAEIYRYCPRCGRELVASVEDARPSCPECGFVKYRNPLPGAVVLVLKDNCVLLGKRGQGSYNPGRWCLPGGYIEYEEDFLTAGIREVKEETGLDIRVIGILSVVSNFLAPELHTLVVVLLAEVVGGSPEAGDDIVELGWFPAAKPLPDMAFEADRHIIKRYFSTGLTGAPVDPRYSHPRVIDEDRTVS
jgi:ADP-ribose pyrophosphatase YjhB (NUDIX family)